MAGNRFIETEHGVFLPTAEPINIAARLTALETSIACAVEEWVVAEGTGAAVGQASRVYHPMPNRPPTSILRLRLRCDGCRLHSIRAEGERLVEGDLHLDVQAACNDAGSGSVTHHPGGERSDPAASERLCGSLLLPADRFQFIVERLRQPGARLSVTLRLPLYKQARADRAVGDPGDADVLYLRYGETMPITGYAIDVLFGPPRGVDDEAAPARETRSHAVESPSVPQRSPGPLSDFLLAAIVLLLVLQLTVALLGS